MRQGKLHHAITEPNALGTHTLQRLGDPYSAADVRNAPAAVAGKTELDAVVAYLQGLGRHAPRGD